MVRYRGIIPPLKNIVNVNTKISPLLPGKSFLDNAYPAGIVVINEVIEPTTV